MKNLLLIALITLLSMSIKAQNADDISAAMENLEYDKAETISLNLLKQDLNYDDEKKIIDHSFAHFTLGFINSFKGNGKFNFNDCYKYLVQSKLIIEKGKSTVVSKELIKIGSEIIEQANNRLDYLANKFPELTNAAKAIEINSSTSSQSISEKITEPALQTVGANSPETAEIKKEKVAETPASNEKTVTITVSGSGKTQDEAKQSALRSAIEQAFGTFISSKTEIFNDQVVADQIASVANGNIKSFSILNESQLPDGSWGVTLKALVSVDKLTSFVEAKGIAIEIKGGLFALNIKQQLLNEQGEVKAISEMVGLLHEPMQTVFDYELKSGDPVSLDAESKNWAIPLVVTATSNKNIDFCADYFIKTIAAISLSSEEVATYKQLNKAVYKIQINHNEFAKTFYLRKQSSLNLISGFLSNWEFYTRLFTVDSGIDKLNGNGKGNLHYFGNKNYFREVGAKPLDPFTIAGIFFTTAGQQAAAFSWQDKRTLSQIEQMTGYKVKPRGVVSQFKHGGFVVYEKEGHGLVTAITDLEDLMDWNKANKSCDELIINGYGDWYLPNKEELNEIYIKLVQYGIGDFNSEVDKMGSSFGMDGYYGYWSSTKGRDEDTMVFQSLKRGNLDFRDKGSVQRVRAVRAF